MPINSKTKDIILNKKATHLHILNNWIYYINVSDNNF